ncbi:MAG: phosphate signaling complex protein PhoU [bacterium]
MLNESTKELKRLFAEQAVRVESMVRNTIEALLQKDEKLAADIIEVQESECNRAEMVISAKIGEIIALYCPRAKEMRYMMAIIQANTDLERVGDLAVNIAQCAQYLIPRRPVKPLIDIPRMAHIAADMVRDALKGFLEENLELSNTVLERDNMVDDLEEQVMRELTTYMASDLSTIERAMRLIFIAKNIERIADLATNVAEDTIYYLTGEDIRHPAEREDKEAKDVKQENSGS